MAKLTNPWVQWGLFKGFPVLALLSALLSLWMGIFALNHPSGIEIDNLLMIWMGFDQLSGDDATTYVALGCIGLLTSVIFTLFIRPNVIVQGQRKNYEQIWKKNPLMGECRTLTAAGTGLDLTSESLRIICEWSTLTRVAESRMVFALYWFTGDIKMISKQSFPSEDALHQFRELVRKQVKNYVDLTKDSL